MPILPVTYPFLRFASGAYTLAIPEHGATFTLLRISGEEYATSPVHLYLGHSKHDPNCHSDLVDLHLARTHKTKRRVVVS
jgi:hypothetical protein